MHDKHYWPQQHALDRYYLFLPGDGMTLAGMWCQYHDSWASEALYGKIDNQINLRIKQSWGDAVEGIWT